MSAPAAIVERLNAMFAPHDSVIGRDLKRNLDHLLFESSLEPEAAAAALVALATAVGDASLAEAGADWLRAAGQDAALIREAREVAALMAMFNTYHHFRSKVADPAALGPVGLRNNTLGRPLMGKLPYERLAFAVSALSGCATCIASHEQQLRDLGATTETLHDLGRLAAILRAVKTLRGA